MNSSKKIPVLAVAATLVVVAILYWGIDRSREIRTPTMARPQQTVATPPLAVSSAAVAPMAVREVPAPAPEAPAGLPAEVEATRRMYLAHAPLRAPEVANPDSESNRRILQTMVAKALNPPKPAANPANARNP
jgi:hypothetical protein